jgi:signal transduction histidine kinase
MQPLRSEMSQHLQEHLTTLLTIPQLLNALNAEAISFGQLNIQNFAQLEHHFWKQSQLFKTVHTIAFGNELGEFIEVGRRTDDTFTINVTNQATQYKFHNYLADNQGNRTDLLAIAKNYDPRDTLWYKFAKQVGKASWSPFYIQEISANVGLAAVKPLYRENGDFIGVFRTEVSLLEINQFLHHLKLEPLGTVFLAERSGELIATSSVAEEVFDPSIHHRNLRRVYAQNSSIPLIRLTAQFLLFQFDFHTQLQTAAQLEVDINYQRRFIQITPLVDGYGIDWLMVLVISETAFTNSMEVIKNSLIWLGSLALLLTIMLSWFTWRWFIQPIDIIKQTTSQLAQGKWQTPRIIHRADEFGELAQAVNTMGENFHNSLLNMKKKGEGCIQQLSKAYDQLKASHHHLLQADKLTSLGQVVTDLANEVNSLLLTIKTQVKLAQETFSATRELMATHDELLNSLIQKPGKDKTYIQTQLTELIASSAAFHQQHVFEDIQQLFLDTLSHLNHVLNLVNNLLNFTKLMQAEIVEMDLTECLDNVLQMAFPLANERITIKRQYVPLPKIQASPSQISQVLLNILTNASEAIEVKGIIWLKAKADDDYVHLTIQDNGKGIPKEILPKIFNAFFTTKPAGQGSGLGLPVSYQIIQQHGGRIKVASQIGKGTQVVISLPHKTVNV